MFSLRKQSTFCLWRAARWPAPQDSDLAQLFVRASGGHRHWHVEPDWHCRVYTRMLVKSSFNQLRTEKEQLTQQYTRLGASGRSGCAMASLGSLASEVSFFTD